MARQLNKKITWVIKNFSSLPSWKIYSDSFVVGGCRWNIVAYPKGNNVAGHLSLNLVADNHQSIPIRWRRHAKFRFILVNQRSDNLSQKFDDQERFDVKFPGWGFRRTIPLNELHDKDSGFLVNGALKIVVEIEVLEVIGELDGPEGVSTIILETIDVNGFELLPSQVESVKCIFERHPDFASSFRPKNRHMKSTYINVLLGLIETLRQSPDTLSEEDLDEAFVALSYLEHGGFKLDWLDRKIVEVKAKKEKVETGKLQLQQIEEELQILNQEALELEALLEKVNTDVSHNNVPLSFDDVLFLSESLV